MLRKLFGFMRKSRLVRVEAAEFPDIPEYLVSRKTLQVLGKHETIFETPGDFHVITEDAVYRYIKPNGKPQIIQTETLEIHPDYSACRVYVNKRTLFQFALQQNSIVFETPNEFVIPFSSITFIAKKRSGIEA
jgi:hypothetical protein